MNEKLWLKKKTLSYVQNAFDEASFYYGSS